LGTKGKEPEKMNAGEGGVGQRKKKINVRQEGAQRGGKQWTLSCVPARGKRGGEMQSERKGAGEKEKKKGEINVPKVVTPGQVNCVIRKKKGKGAKGENTWFRDTSAFGRQKLGHYGGGRGSKQNKGEGKGSVMGKATKHQKQRKKKNTTEGVWREIKKRGKRNALRLKGGKEKTFPQRDGGWKPKIQIKIRVGQEEGFSKKERADHRKRGGRA